MDIQKQEEQSLIGRGRSPLSRRIGIALVLLLLWNILLSAMVVKLYATPQNPNTIIEQATPITGTFLLPPQHTLHIGDVVSLTEDGLIQRGGGTTLYRNISAFDLTDLVRHLEVTNLGSSRLVFAYNDVVQIVDIDEFNNFKYYSQVNIGHSVDDVVELTPSMFVVVGTNTVRAFSVSEAGMVSQGPLVDFVAPPSINSEITALDSTHFALSYYNASSNNDLWTMVGTVSSTLNITLSKPVRQSSDKMTHGIVGLTPTSYLLLTPNATGFGIDRGSIIAHLAIVSGNPPTVSITASASLPAEANFFFGAARLSDTRAIVVFVDKLIDDGLRAAVIEVIDETIFFGATMAINDGDVSGIDDGLWMFIHVSPLGLERFLVVYADLANSGRVTVAIGALTDGADLVLISPSFVITEPYPHRNDYYWVASTSLSDNVFIIADSLTGDKIYGGRVTIGSILPPPIGIISSINGNHTTVVVSGLVNVNNSIPGKVYYATTQGKIIEGSHKANLVDPNPDLYVVNGNIITTLGSEIGVALSSTQLFIKTV